MPKISTNGVRSQFIKFFVNKGHKEVPSSSTVPFADPTLLFVNAGMNQFKDIFTGTMPPGGVNEELAKHGRVVDSQKCVRAGGKHNDLDDVGKDVYHHTMFEMLGNWSFGTYFKEEAISWAWELLVDEWKIDPERLYATYFEGDGDLPADEDAKKIWGKFLPESRILKGNKKDNFWEMGEIGPCGPCSEIHYDRIGGRDAASLVNMDDPDVLEVWNIVFMQYNRESKEKLTPLPKPCVDAGMGLERVTSVLNDVRSNYDIDLWDPLFAAIQKATGHPEAYSHSLDTNSDVDVAYRVVADHIRTLTFTILDGARPGKEGRSYVIRSIIRRAIRFGREFLGAKEAGWLASIVPAVVESMGEAYPQCQVERDIHRVQETLRQEEAQFIHTFDSGLELYKQVVEKVKGAGSTEISGRDAFVLHSRYGFLKDITNIMAIRDGLTVDLAGFSEEEKKHQAASKGSIGKAKAVALNPECISELQKIAPDGTDATFKYVWEPHSSTVIGIVDPATNTLIEKAESGKQLGLILKTTNFYAEQGGQVGDSGKIANAQDDVYDVVDTQVSAGFVVHYGSVMEGQTVSVGDSLTCAVDFDRRADIAANHTTTHVLNWVLREVLATDGEEVNQQGSLVNEQLLRFDFSYNAKLTDAQIEQVQTKLNEVIKANKQVYSKEVEKELATQISSLRCMFGEKYPPKVRVLSVGEEVERVLEAPTDAKWQGTSIEFCGGTHLKQTGDADEAVIISEQALGGGVRRMVAYTKERAHVSIRAGEEFRAGLVSIEKNQGQDHAEKLKSIGVWRKKLDDSDIPFLTKQDLRAASDAIGDRLRKEQKELLGQAKARGTEHGRALAKRVEEGDLKFAVCVVDDLMGDRPALEAVTKAFNESDKGKTTPHIILAYPGNGKPGGATAVVPADMVGQINAAEWVKATCGKGGGKPFLANGAGLDDSQREQAVEKATAFANGKLA